MSVPSITLWTDSFRMPLRLSVCPFDVASVDHQVAEIQEKTHRYIEITPGALYILSCIAGRRMPEPVRWVLLDSLRDILNGKLRNQFPERQDLLASTFGELLGVALLALRLGGEVEVVRLLESPRGKMPDFLLLQVTPGGTIAHVLECKGRVEDVRNINDLTGAFDLCQEQRNFRAKAKKQIDGICSSPLRSGAQTVIRQKMPFDFARMASTKNIVVSSVPDGRLVRECTHTAFARRKQCQPPSRVTCVKCMTNARNGSQTNVISALYWEEIAKNSPINQALLAFLKNYRAAQRAVWSENEDLFALSLNNLANQITNRSIRGEAIPSSVFMLITLLEIAKSEGFRGFDIDTLAIGELVPEELRVILDEVYRELVAESQRDGRQSDLVPIPYLQGSLYWQQWRVEQDRVAERFRGENGRVTGPLITQTADFLLKEVEIPVRAAISGTDVYGSAQNEKHSAVVRLASTNQAALEKYVSELITQLRDGIEDPPVVWLDEFFQDESYEKAEGSDPTARQKRYIVGKSWDMFPYPYQKLGLPGITAWIAEDGRAEIFVRKLGYMNRTR